MTFQRQPVMPSIPGSSQVLQLYACASVTQAHAPAPITARTIHRIFA